MEFASDTITERDNRTHGGIFVVTIAFPTKRKAESDPADEIEESGDAIEDIGDEIEEISNKIEESGDNYVESINEYCKSKWITPEWDVDSFHGLTFDHSQEKTEYINFYDDVDVEQWLRFRRQHIENKGFYVDPEL